MMRIKKDSLVIAGLIFLEVSLFVFFFFYLTVPYIEYVVAVVNVSNVTVKTILEVGAVYPEVLNVMINDDATGIDLVPNASVVVNVSAIIRDYNGEGDVANVSARFFDIGTSSWDGTLDNNEHYRNDSCQINYAYGDEYTLEALCTVDVWYYANNFTWNGSVLATDNTSRTAMGSDTITMNTLLGIGLPDVIDYGKVNSTDVSDEVIANVTNFGNTMFNLTLSGYARTPGDGYAMNCSLGYLQNISVYYEKYNLTVSNPGGMDLSTFESYYENLTADSVIKRFNLDYRRDDSAPYLDDTNSTYWRIYVPIGVAGNCTGNIVFGAVKASGT